jgi:hypothetical protein
MSLLLLLENTSRYGGGRSYHSRMRSRAIEEKIFRGLYLEEGKEEGEEEIIEESKDNFHTIGFINEIFMKHKKVIK